MTKNGFPKYLFILPILVYLILAFIHIYIPGINSDEILFGNAAVGLINTDTHIAYTISDFPVLLMPYIGALKSYIYYPIFKLFGVSVLSIRIPMILLSAVTIYMAYRIMLISTRSVFISFFTALFLATHASFITYTRTDQGPMAIELFLKTLAILLFITCIAEKKTKYLAWLPLVIFLGVFNKLNFVWTLNAFIFAVVIFYKDIRAFIKAGSGSRFQIIFFPLLTVIISISYYAYISSKAVMLRSYFPEELSISFFTHRFLAVYDLLHFNFKGVIFLSYMYENPINYAKISFAPFLPSTILSQLTKYNFEIAFFIIFICFFINAYHFFIKKDDTRKYALFFTLIFLGILPQIFIVTNANAGWHVFTVYPMLIFSLFSSLGMILKNKIAQLGIIALFIMGNINDYAFNVSAFENLTPMNVWTTKIHDLVNYTKKVDSKFYQITWGTDDQLITFTQQKNKFFKAYEYGDEMFPDDEPFANTQEARNYMFDHHIKDKYENSYYIVSWQKNLWFGNYYIFEKTLAENDLVYETVENFYDKKQVIYSILKVKKKTL